MKDPWVSYHVALTIEEHRAEAFRKGQQIALAQAIDICKRSRAALRTIPVIWDEKQIVAKRMELLYSEFPKRKEEE